MSGPVNSSTTQSVQENVKPKPSRKIFHPNFKSRRQLPSFDNVSPLPIIQEENKDPIEEESQWEMRATWLAKEDLVHRLRKSTQAVRIEALQQETENNTLLIGKADLVRIPVHFWDNNVIANFRDVAPDTRSHPTSRIWR